MSFVSLHPSMQRIRRSMLPLYPTTTTISYLWYHFTPLAVHPLIPMWNAEVVGMRDRKCRYAWPKLSVCVTEVVGMRDRRSPDVDVSTIGLASTNSENTAKFNFGHTMCGELFSRYIPLFWAHSNFGHRFGHRCGHRFGQRFGHRCGVTCVCRLSLSIYCPRPCVVNYI